MAIVYVGPNYLTCLSSDSKPATLTVNFIAYETDTDLGFVWDGGQWNPITVNKSGVEVQSGDGSTDFVFPHGFGNTPTTVLVTAGSLDAVGFYATANTTNITVSYSSPPPTASNNLKWYWFVV